MSKLDRLRSQLEHLVFKFQIEVSTDFFDEIFLNSFLHSIHCEIKKRMHLPVITLSSLGNQCDVTRISRSSAKTTHFKSLCSISNQIFAFKVQDGQQCHKLDKSVVF